jgi:hypothetical protein
MSPKMIYYITAVMYAVASLATGNLVYLVIGLAAVFMGIVFE